MNHGFSRRGIPEVKINVFIEEVSYES
jgi:hypothetical protein